MNGRRFEGGTFEGIVKKDCTLEGYTFCDCTFSGCALENVRLVRCAFSGCRFTGCRVSEPETLHSTVSLAVLTDCALVGVDWARLLPAGMFAEPIEAMKGCRLDRTEFFHCDLRRSDFRGAVGYQIDAAANRLKDAAFSLPEAVRLLHGLGIRPDG